MSYILIFLIKPHICFKVTLYYATSLFSNIDNWHLFKKYSCLEGKHYSISHVVIYATVNICTFYGIFLQVYLNCSLNIL